MSAAPRRSEPASPAGVALIMVLIVLSCLAMIGIPFVASMMLHDRASRSFAAGVAALQAAQAARNHAIALLRRTAYPSEWEAEAEALEPERPRVSLHADGFRPSARTAFRERRGTVVRRDLGEARAARRGGRARVGSGDRDRAAEIWRTSERGPSPKDHDEEGEIDVRLPDELVLPEEAPPDPMLLGDGRRVRFRDPGGITASAQVIDEQGKININTAP
ncbi:MAG: hypothetical protein JXA90_00705, partial [Planctomycetes bacterium]|nr:hypothetical protein [Planctomycetota bacterium]